MFERLVEFQIKHNKALLVIILLVLVLFGYYALQMKVDPRLETLISTDSEYNTQKRILTNAFGQQGGMTVLIKLDDASEVSIRPTSLQDSSLDAFYTDLKTTMIESQYVDTVTGPEFSKDNKYGRFTLSVRVPERVDGTSIVEAELKGLLAQVGTPTGVETVLGGFPLLLNRIPRLLIQDSLTTMAITLAMILIILFFYFRNTALTIVALGTPLASLVMLAGFMTVLGIDITVTLAAVGVFVIGLGVDYGIHITLRYQDMLKRGHSSEKALKITIDHLWLPITASFLTTLAGFSALILGVSPSSQSQGVVLALGIAIIFFMSMVLVPTLLAFLGKQISVRHSETFDMIIGQLAKLAVFQSRHPRLVLTVVAILTVIMFFGMVQVKFSTSNSNWIPDEDPISKSFREIIFAYSDDDSLQVVLQAQSGDLRDVFTAKDVQRLVEAIRNVPRVDSVTSAYDGLQLSSSEVFEGLTKNEAWFNKDFTVTTIRIASEDFGVDDQGKSVALKEIQELVRLHPIHNARVNLFGDVVRFDELSDSLQADAQTTTMIGFALVFLVASMVYGSFVVGLSALIPIIIAIIWAVGLMGYFNVPFTSLSTGIVSLVLGIGSDFSIHLVDGIRRNVHRGHSLEKSIKETLLHTGSPILISSVTTLFGFLALTGATLLGTQRLGLSLALAILSVFIVAVSMVPAIMSVYLKKSFKKSST